MSIQADETSNIAVNLELLDLERDASRIYVSLLHGGPMAPMAISQELAIPRTNVYRISARLRELGLVDFDQTEPKRTRIQARHPEALERLVNERQQRIDAQKQLLPSIVGALASLSNAGPLRSHVMHYDGLEGIKQVRMNSLEAKTDLWQCARIDLNDVINFGHSETVREEWARRQVQIRELTNSAVFENWTQCHTLVRDCWTIRYVDPGEFFIEFETLIYNNVIALYGRKHDKLFAVEIRSEDLVAWMRQFFDFVWSRALPMTILDEGGAAALARR